MIGVLSLAFAAGCGSSSSSGGNAVVAQVAGKKITESTLNHWTAVFMRGDFYQAAGRKAPIGFASDPPRPEACVSVAKTFAAKTVPTPGVKKPKLSEGQLQVKCRALYTQVRQEALGYVLSILWGEGQVAELGRKVTDREVQQNLKELIVNTYHTQQNFQTTLANKGWSLADIQYIIRRNILGRIFVAALKAKAAKLGGGQSTFVKLVNQSNAKWSTKTNCRPQDLVWECQEYKPSAALGSSSPAVLLEEMGARSAL
jgi:hypothetical protein